MSDSEYETETDSDNDYEQPKIQIPRLASSWIERFDPNKLAYLIAHEDEFKQLVNKIPKKPEYDMFNIARKYLGKSRDGKITVNYKQVVDGAGRYHALGSLSMQTLCRGIRHTIGGEFYDDIDMVNAHPVILNHMCEKWGLRHTRLNQYVNNREKYLTNISSKCGVSREFAKTTVLSMMNGGREQYERLKRPTAWLVSFNKEVKKILQSIVERFPAEYAKQKDVQHDKGRTRNFEASFCNTKLCAFENDILSVMAKYFTDRGVITDECVLCFDGVMVPKSSSLNQAMLSECEELITETCGGIIMKLKVKPMDEGWSIPDDIPKYDELKLDYYPQFTAIVNKEIYEDTAWAWVKNALVLIEGCGEPFFLAKNRRVDCITNAESVTYTPARIEKLMNALKVELKIINEAHDPGITEGAKGNTRLQNFRGRCYKYTVLGNTRCKNDRSYLKRLMELREIPHAGAFEFFPFLARKYGAGGVPMYDCFNTFTGFPMERVPHTPGLRFEDSLMYNHIKNELMNGDQGEFDHFMDHIADIIQCPAEVRGPSHLFYTRQGMGKGMMGVWITGLLGGDHVMSFENIDDYMRRFNYDQANKLLKIFEELKDKGTAFHQHDRLKGDQTKVELRIEIKGGSVLKIRHCARHWYYTNNANSMYIEVDCRRHTCHRSNNRYANNQTYFAPIWKEVKNPAFIKCCFEYFAERKYDVQNVLRAYDTPYKREQKLVNLNNGLKYIIYLAECNYDGVRKQGDYVTITSLWDGYQTWCSDMGLRSNTRHALIQQLGRVNSESPKTIRFGVVTHKCVYLNTDQLRVEFRNMLKWPEFDFDIMPARIVPVADED